MKLYGYWRSLAAFRVRIALNLKGIPFEVESMDLVKGDQFSDAYRKVNPQMVVPALVDGDTVLTQSMAILEYLEDVHPEPALLPADAAGRARVRSICLISVADIHPLLVPRIRKYITQDMGHSEEELTAWIHNWMTTGLAAIEEKLAGDAETGAYCHGDSLTLADLCLVPQVGAAAMFGVDTDAYPTCKRIFGACMQVPEIFDARPQAQPDFPEEMK
ncbi:MAG: maleylacetoacetate isomerase [Alphaproteobacteria bacterium]|nr:maleylacetoacetate isomerase [Alphaproteobacteria bacterium]